MMTLEELKKYLKELEALEPPEGDDMAKAIVSREIDRVRKAISDLEAQ